jgi:ribosomal protein L12E/L44/L45/RPP1/RPP2
METVIVIVLAFILGVFTEKARVEARKELKAMKAANTKEVISKATAPVVQVSKSAPPVKKTQKAPAKKATKKAVAKKTVAKKTSTPKKN